MGYAAELIMDVDDDANWAVAGDTFGLIFASACVSADDKQARPQSEKSPSPNLLVAQDGAKNVIGAALQGVAYDDDSVSTVGGASILAEDSRSTVDVASDGYPTQKSEVQLMEELQATRLKARTLLQESAQNGSLEAAMEQIKLGKSVPEAGSEARDQESSPPLNGTEDIEEIRLSTRRALLDGLTDGRLDAVFDEVHRSNQGGFETAEEHRMFVQKALLQGLNDGRLETLLAEASQRTLEEARNNGSMDAVSSKASKQNSDYNEEDVKAQVKNVLEESFRSGELLTVLQAASQPSALVPQPPPGGPPASGSPVRTRRILGGSNAAQVMQMISDADRKVGSLQTQVKVKERECKERDETCQKLTENIQVVRADIQHLSIDLEWHQEQIQVAEDRFTRLNEDRRALALKLDEMRLKGQKDEWPAASKTSPTGRSLTSTATGGATAALDAGSFSGWATDRSALPSQAQTFVTQNSPGRS